MAKNDFSARRPTIADVARLAGVARSTVSHALNNKGYVEAKTREKILKAVKALGYRPNLRAQGLRTGGVKTISLVSAMPLGVSGGVSKLGFLMEIAAVAAEEAVARGLALILVPPQPAGGALPALEVDGSIFVEPEEKDDNLETLLAGNYPMVCLGRWPGHDDVPYVDLMSGYTARLLLTHLREAGVKRIAVFIGAAQRNSYIETEAEYQRFCEAERMEPVIVRLDEQGGELAGQVAALELFRRHPKVDGILALVDAFATGVIQAAHATGVKIPEQLKIATRYDGLRAKLAAVPLTAVDLHLDQVARMGVELLAETLKNPGQPMTLRPEKPLLVPRRSSGGE